MAASFTLGMSGGLYITDPATDLIDQLPGGTGTEDYTTVAWLEITNATDVNMGGDPETVDLTTRESARTGFTSEIDIIQKGQITTGMSVKDLTSDPLLSHIVDAKIGATELSVLNLTKQITAADAWGFCGNFTVNFANTYPVKGAQTVAVTFKLVSFAAWVKTVAGNDLQAF